MTPILTALVVFLIAITSVLALMMLFMICTTALTRAMAWLNDRRIEDLSILDYIVYGLLRVSLFGMLTLDSYVSQFLYHHIIVSIAIGIGTYSYLMRA